MNYNLEIQKILLQVEKLSNPDDKINLLKQAITLADANNDLDWGFDLRLDLISKEIDTSHCTDSFPAFAWLLSTYDANPDLFDEEDFLWEYKWMSSAARRNAGISREQVENIMADLKERMNRNGYSDRAYYNIMFYWHLFIGEYDEARKYIKLRDESTHDRMSHCEACELDSRVEMALIDGELDKAITLAHDIITKKQTCGRLPFATFCNLTTHLHKVNDPRAEEFFAKAEEELNEIENDTSFLADVAELMRYLTKTNKDKAWQYFERYADWEVGAEDALCFEFALACLSVLNKEEGVRKMNINPKLPYFNTANEYDLKELFDYYHKKATDLADRFDARHGNNYFNKQLSEILA
ncbi:hypothetical protein D0T53_02945 [Dysgonomonas sp. 216]|uniref:hypothetical protein n=1 Tax=Dysgonomonas sp. 216 TaxID=2302934 RepID=UPI0013D23149|nr:hypothetical protein [Dysgonomonas sp. 216]NDW17874.1 hypothetical protein [Dysgonomonas sp. 216]